MWKDIPNYPGYQAAPDGRIKGPTGKELKPSLNRRGYYVVCVRRKPMYIHRLIALTFLTQDPSFDIHHKDGDRSNNSVDNLEAIPHLIHMALHGDKNKKPVGQYDLQGNLIQVYSSLSEAMAQLPGDSKHGGIKQAVAGIRPTAYGYKWKYIQ